MDAGAALDGGIQVLQEAYRQGLSPLDVVDEVLERIDRLGDPAIWIDIESATNLRQAAKALVENTPIDHPLWGIPFGVKDNIDVAGRITTAALPGIAQRAEHSAPVVQRLVDAGALYVGKTNLDQLATGLVGTRSPYGVPINPLDSSLIPGGSSSGSAVAVARRQVSFALGTDTAGSGRVPAAMCGVVGMKGVPGGHPLEGVLPASPSIDCISIFSLSVQDGLTVEAVLGAKPWPVAVGQLVVGVSDTSIEEAKILRDCGHQVVKADLGIFHAVGDLLYGGALLADRTGVLGPILAAVPEGVNSIVAEVIAGGTKFSGIDVFEAQRFVEQTRRSLDDWWKHHDVLVVPTITWIASLEEVAKDPIGTNIELGRNTTFANLLGLASITVPTSDGPGGVTVLGPAKHLGAIAAVAASLNGEDLGELSVTSNVASGNRTLLAVVGAHLRGQPLNKDLVERGAEFVECTVTSPHYRLYSLPGGPPARPGLERVNSGGASIEVEIVTIDDAGLGSLMRSVPAPLAIGSIELLDGRWVNGFVCEPIGLVDATDITTHGGWRNYLTGGSKS